jgi:hypothetical protein
MHKILVRRIDFSTKCFLDQELVRIDDLRWISDVLLGETIQRYRLYDLASGQYILFAEKYSLPAPEDADLRRICLVKEDFELDSATHTGRELILMLSNKKPFAQFIATGTAADEQLDAFDSHVVSGKIRKFEFVWAPKKLEPQTFKRVCFCLPGEEWRFKSYQMLWKLADEYGWNSGFERVEGYLLGYNVEIDDFFRPL